MHCCGKEKVICLHIVWLSHYNNQLNKMHNKKSNFWGFFCQSYVIPWRIKCTIHSNELSICLVQPCFRGGGGKLLAHPSVSHNQLKTVLCFQAHGAKETLRLSLKLFRVGCMDFNFFIQLCVRSLIFTPREMKFHCLSVFQPNCLYVHSKLVLLVRPKCKTTF